MWRLSNVITLFPAVFLSCFSCFFVVFTCFLKSYYLSLLSFPTCSLWNSGKYDVKPWRTYPEIWKCCIHIAGLPWSPLDTVCYMLHLHGVLQLRWATKLLCQLCPQPWCRWDSANIVSEYTQHSVLVSYWAWTNQTCWEARCIDYSDMLVQLCHFCWVASAYLTCWK